MNEIKKKSEIERNDSSDANESFEEIDEFKHKDFSSVKGTKFDDVPLSYLLDAIPSNPSINNLVSILQIKAFAIPPIKAVSSSSTVNVVASFNSMLILLHLLKILMQFNI